MGKNDYGPLKAKLDSESKPLKSPHRPDIQEIADEPEELRRFVFGLQDTLSKGLIEDQKVDVQWQIDQQLDYIMLQYRTWLYGEAVDRYRYQYPANWFEHLKERVLPHFIRIHWPVRYRSFKIDIVALYPELRKKLHYPDEVNLIHVEHEEVGEKETTPSIG